MKKWILLLVLVIAMVSFAMVMTLTGCQDDKSDGTNPSDQSEETDVVGKPGGGDSGEAGTGDETDNSQTGDNTSGTESENQPEKVLTFAEFLLMTPAEQQAYMDSYADIMDFLEWYRVAEEQYKEEQEDIEIGGSGDINIGDYIN